MLRGWAWAGVVPENSGGNWLNCSEGLHSKIRAWGCLPGGQVPPAWRGWQGWRESGKDLQQAAGTSALSAWRSSGPVVMPAMPGLAHRASVVALA